MSTDIHGKCWPYDVRSMSVGDLVRVSYDRPAWSYDPVDFRAGPRSEDYCAERSGWRVDRTVAAGNRDRGAGVISRTADTPVAPPDVEPPRLTY